VNGSRYVATRELEAVVSFDVEGHRIVANKLANENKNPCIWRFSHGLENRFGPLGPTRVQIPPPPLNKAERHRKALRFTDAPVSKTAIARPRDSTSVQERPLIFVPAGELLANESTRAASRTR
jgi:hypothetical protein